MARYEAEETVKARGRKAETQIKEGLPPSTVTAPAQGPRTDTQAQKGESAAIIAEPEHNDFD